MAIAFHHGRIGRAMPLGLTAHAEQRHQALECRQYPDRYRPLGSRCAPADYFHDRDGDATSDPSAVMSSPSFRRRCPLPAPVVLPSAWLQNPVPLQPAHTGIPRHGSQSGALHAQDPLRLLVGFVAAQPRKLIGRPITARVIASGTDCA